jgi:hypothetical protein
MTYEEIVAYYRSSGVPYWEKAQVWKRSEIPNTDMSLSRGAACVCGFCGKGDPCVCGQDLVVDGRNCMSCGRPWWCKR